MQPKRDLIMVFLILFLSGPRLSYAQQFSECVAVITEINGKALLKEAGMSSFVKATWGTRLFKGDQVATADKSEVKLLYADNNFIVLGPNSMITVSGKESDITEPIGEVKRVKSAAIVNLSSLTISRDERKDVGALAGVRSVYVTNAIEPDTPYSTVIKNDRPSFSWHAEQEFDKYTVNLYDSKGLVWSCKISGSTMKYPENEKALKSGESYYWNVEAEYLKDTERSASHKFTVISPEKYKEIAAHESAIRSSFIKNPESSSLHSLLGAYYIDQGLIQDAISEFRIIAGINPDVPLPHEILGSLYSDIGEKDKAIEELQKALALSDSMGN